MSVDLHKCMYSYGRHNEESPLLSPPLRPQTRLSLNCLLRVNGAVKISGIEWYNGINGYISLNCPCLAVAFDNGRAQIMKHELDGSESCRACGQHHCPCLCLKTLSHGCDEHSQVRY